jgi:hypothetical protein
MKKSIKLTALLSVIFLAGSLSVKAQTKTPDDSKGGVIYSIGIETSLSVGDFNKGHKGSLGGSIQADIPLSEKWFVNVNTGYDNFYGRHHDGVAPVGLRFIPALVGLKYFPFSNFYVQADAGAGFLTNKSDLGYSRSSAFLYAPEIGLRLPVGDNSFIDAGVRYEEATRFEKTVVGSKLNVIGFRLAYAFGL